MSKVITTTSFSAWAIATGEKGFIGRYWWFGGKPTIPIHLEGCRTALFTTRALARENLYYVKSSYPKARIVRVSVNLLGEEKT